MIDDHVTVCILRRGHHVADRPDFMHLVHEGEAAYAEENLLRHEKKQVRDANKAVV